MSDYNNPDNVIETYDFDITASSGTSFIEFISTFPDVLNVLENKEIPVGYTLVMRGISPLLPAGIYKRGSYWSEIVDFDLDEDGEIDGTTVNNYQVISTRDIDYSKATDFQKWLYDNLQQLTNYYENITGQELSDRFGIFVLRNKIITQSTLPESEKGLLADLGWSFKDGKWTQGKEKSQNKDKADITPLLFAAIGGLTGGAPGALAGFLFSLVTQQKDKADKQKTVSTETVTASSVGIPNGIGFNI
jgi:hypothetical protein